MGRIYTQATCVIAWLGIDPKTNEFLGQMSQHDHYQNVPADLRMSFLDNDYWGRAWIVQEIVLARQVFLVTNKTCLKYEKVPKYLGRLGSSLPEQDLNGKSLTELLSLHRLRGCATKRDRIFSLSALCSEDIPVDYSITDEQIFHQTLKACHETLCFCTVSVVAQALEVQHLDMNSGPTVQLKIAPVPSRTTCCQYGGSRLPVMWDRDAEQSLLFCLSPLCQDLTMHLYCEKTPDSGIYRAYLCHWRNVDLIVNVTGFAVAKRDLPGYSDPFWGAYTVHIDRKSNGEQCDLRLSLPAVVFIAMMSQHCWDHIIPHKATLKISWPGELDHFQRHANTYAARRL
jgi:hypothetical protein